MYVWITKKLQYSETVQLYVANRCEQVLQGVFDIDQLLQKNEYSQAYSVLQELLETNVRGFAPIHITDKLWMKRIHTSVAQRLPILNKGFKQFLFSGHYTISFNRLLNLARVLKNTIIIQSKLTKLAKTFSQDKEKVRQLIHAYSYISPMVMPINDLKNIKTKLMNFVQLQTEAGLEISFKDNQLCFGQGLTVEQEKVLKAIFKRANRSDLVAALAKLHDESVAMRKISIKYNHSLLLAGVTTAASEIEKILSKYIISIDTIRKVCEYGFKISSNNSSLEKTQFNLLSFASVADYVLYNTWIIQELSGITVFNDYVDEIIKREQQEYNPARIILIDLDENEEKFIKTIPGVQYIKNEGNDDSTTYHFLDISTEAPHNLDELLLHAPQLIRKRRMLWNALNKNSNHMEAVVRITGQSGPIVLRIDPQADKCLVYNNGISLGAVYSLEDLDALPLYINGEIKQELRQAYKNLQQQYSLSTLRKQGLRILQKIQARVTHDAGLELLR